jgi:hypothetical protein
VNLEPLLLASNPTDESSGPDQDRARFVSALKGPKLYRRFIAALIHSRSSSAV